MELGDAGGVCSQEHVQSGQRALRLALTGHAVSIREIRVVKQGESSMKMKSPYAFGLAVFLSFVISIPADVWAAPQSAGPRAGEVSRLVPAVTIDRNGNSMTAAAKTAADRQSHANNPR